MAAESPKVRSLSSTLAAEIRHHGVAKESTRRELAEARLEEFIRRTVDSAPPLSDNQRDRLALLLQGGTA